MTAHRAKGLEFDHVAILNGGWDRPARAEVTAIRTRRREDGDEEYHHLLRRGEWEVVLPELMFEAGAQAVMADQNGS